MLPNKRGLALAAIIAVFTGCASQAADFPVTSVRPVAAPASNNPWAELSFGPFYAEPSGYGGYASFLFSPKGDVWAEGWLVRLDAAAGRYPYTGNAFVNVGVNYYTADVLVGYRHNFSPASHLTVFLGPDFSSTDHPDPLGTPNGSEWGVKTALDFSGPIAQRLGFDLYASLSSIRTNYFVQARIGYSFTPSVTIGPEVAVLGSSGNDQMRLGLYAKANMGWAEIGANVGNQWNEGGQSTGLYAGANMTIRLRR